MPFSFNLRIKVHISVKCIRRVENVCPQLYSSFNTFSIFGPTAVCLAAANVSFVIIEVKRINKCGFFIFLDLPKEVFEHSKKFPEKSSHPLKKSE